MLSRLKFPTVNGLNQGLNCRGPRRSYHEHARIANRFRIAAEKCLESKYGVVVVFERSCHGRAWSVLNDNYLMHHRASRFLRNLVENRPVDGLYDREVRNLIDRYRTYPLEKPEVYAKYDAFLANRVKEVNK